MTYPTGTPVRIRGFQTRYGTVLYSTGDKVRVEVDGRERTVHVDQVSVVIKPMRVPVGKVERAPDYSAGHLLPVRHDEPTRRVRQRRPRWTSEAYLAWVREKACAWCHASGPSDPHHWPTKGAGGSDLRVVPLCRGCHDHWHQHATFPGAPAQSATSWREWFMQHQLALHDEWVAREEARHG